MTIGDLPGGDKPKPKRRWWLWVLGFVLLLALCDDDDDKRRYCYTFGSERRCFDQPMPKDAYCYLMDDGTVQCFAKPLK